MILKTLTEEDMVECFKAIWSTSFSGIAIVGEDFKFKAVNPQFARLLKVTPAELLNKKFSDVTVEWARLKDEENAKLVKEGMIPSYTMPKSYQFITNGQVRTVDVVLLVVRIPVNPSKNFRFFLSRIMLDESQQTSQDPSKIVVSPTTYPPATPKVMEFLMKYGKVLTAVGVIIGTAILTLLGVKL